MEHTENSKSKTDGTSGLLVTGINELVKKINEFKGVNSLTIATIGAILIECKAKKQYKKYASHIEKFQDFLREVDISVTKAKHYMDIWNFWGLKLLEESCDIEKLIKAIPVIRKGGNPDEWFIKAKTLSHADFNNEIYQTRGKRNSSICEHPHTKEWHKCEECGAWIKGTHDSK